MNEWWTDDPDQRYWLEITDRYDLGGDLLAPKESPNKKPVWSYTTVALTNPGDIVLHWQDQAIRGWSEVVGPLSSGTTTWQAHGTVGRKQGKTKPRPCWIMPLGGFHEIATPNTLAELNQEAAAVISVRDKLANRHGDPVYFPFVEYRPGILRTQQAYLAKFPKELLTMLPALADLAESDTKAGGVAASAPGARSSFPRQQDPAVRSAIERHAVEKAKQHYGGPGITITELGKPYDLRVRSANEDRHVEVKGSASTLSSVELTVNEVFHAESHTPTDLFVVDGIEWERSAKGGIKTDGGRERIWRDWNADEDDLSPTKYNYELPPTEFYE